MRQKSRNLVHERVAVHVHDVGITKEGTGFLKDFDQGRQLG
jgi:hypothetical protein